MQKSAQPARVLIGEPVEYTLSVANSGQVTGTVAVISDTLDPSLTFVGMSAGSEVPAPVEVSGTLVWTGPFTVPVGDDLLVKYEASTSGGPGWSWPCNRAEAWAEGALLGPVQACVEVGPAQGLTFLPTVYKGIKWPYFSAAKAADPALVMASTGTLVTYTVTLHNEGDLAGVLGSVVDTLPAGFTFVEMVPGSDVMANPSGTSGTITWNGPFNVAGGGQLRVIFRATPSDTPGVYVNWANATALVGHAPWTPASATVTVEPGVLLHDDFNQGIDLWTPFLNYHRLEPGQWYWGATDGVNGTGGLTHDCCTGDEVASDALMMYLGEGAEQWRNYRVETKVYLTGGVDKYGNPRPYEGDPIALWVRGQWEPHDVEGKWVTGYYVVVTGASNDPDHFLRLAQMRQPGDCGDACREYGQYAFNNPMVLLESELVPGPFEHYRWYDLAVEVRGNNIKAWLDGQLLIDYTDEVLPFMEGTVGFKVHETKTASFDDIVVTYLP